MLSFTLISLNGAFVCIPNVPVKMIHNKSFRGIFDDSSDFGEENGGEERRLSTSFSIIFFLFYSQCWCERTVVRSLSLVSPNVDRDPLSVA